jgi:hypothetical protein
VVTEQTDFMTAALIRVFRPLVRLLLRFNIPYKACAEALKWTYVDVAANEFAMGAQKQTKSRVAVITGLTRIEVEKLQREGAKTTKETTKLYNRAARVLSAWEHDPHYRNADGVLLTLPLEGSGPSIVSLVTDFSGGATVRAVLDELLSKGNVRYQPTSDRYEFLSADFLVFDDREAELNILATATSDMLGTIERNIRPQQTDRRMQAYVEQIHMPEHQIAQVRAFVKLKGNAFLDELDGLLVKLASAPPESSQTETALCPRLGLGMYYFQDEPPQISVQMDNRGRRSRRELEHAKQTSSNPTPGANS